MVALMSSMEEISNKMGLAINRSKTKIMVMDSSNRLKLTGVHSLETVKNFNYVSSVISNNDSCEAGESRWLRMPCLSYVEYGQLGISP